LQKGIENYFEKLFVKVSEITEACYDVKVDRVVSKHQGKEKESNEVDRI
jgi:hypothetical protein